MQAENRTNFVGFELINGGRVLVPSLGWLTGPSVAPGEAQMTSSTPSFQSP